MSPFAKWWATWWADHRNLFKKGQEQLVAEAAYNAGWRAALDHRERMADLGISGAAMPSTRVCRRCGGTGSRVEKNIEYCPTCGGSEFR